jgi:hypothetical protein
VSKWIAKFAKKVKLGETSHRFGDFRQGDSFVPFGKIKLTMGVGHLLTLIAVSSFGKGLRWGFLTKPAEAIF